MPRLLSAALLGASLLTPVLRAQDHPPGRTYHDKQHNDDHQWNGQEDKAYGAWVKETHRKNTNFAKLKNNDQQAYWGWRHEHSDALLQIDIH